MLETYLELLLAVQDGDHSIPALAEASGLSETDTAQAVTQLQVNGFLSIPATSGPDTGRYRILPPGRTLLRLGCDEVFKRALTERLGGADDSAS